MVEKKIPKRRNGYYYKGDQGYPSVTTILKVLDKPGLLYGGIYAAAKIALKDPTLSDKEVYAKVMDDWKVSAKRGQYVHNVAEIWAKENIIPTGKQPQHQEYINGFLSWFYANQPKPIASELELYSDKWVYAGRCDLICEIQGIKWLIDFKTNPKGDIYREAGLQSVAYKQALSEMGTEIDKMGVVCFTVDGTFTFKEFNESLEDFLSVYAVWKWSKKKE